MFYILTVAVAIRLFDFVEMYRTVYIKRVILLQVILQ